MFKLTPPVLTSWPGYDNLACGTDRDDEDGFTLIEILVVIIIIGILAAVAIPIFLNQQKAARDSATTQDTRNAATNLETGLVYDPLATEYKAFEDNAGSPGAPIPAATDGSVTVTAGTEEFHLQVGNGATAPVEKSEGTVLRIQADDVDGDGTQEGGAFRVDGWNEKGKEHKNDSTLVYRNALGGLQDEKGTGSGSTTPGDGSETPGDGSENPGTGGGTETETPGGGKLEIDGISHAEGDWWKGSTGWVTAIVPGTAPSTITQGEETTFQVYAYLPADKTGTGEAHFAPDGMRMNWELTEMGIWTMDSGSVVSSGGKFEITFTAPADATAPMTFFAEAVTLPDGSSTETNWRTRAELEYEFDYGSGNRWTLMS